MAQDFEKLNIQWFPGHMTKAQRMIEEHMKQADAVCEILDARIPMASRNPDIDRLAGDKPRIVVLNRTDLADPKATARWRAAFQRQGMTVLETDSRSGKGVNGAIYWTDQTSWSNENTLNYKKRLGRSHNLDLMAGLSLLGLKNTYDGVASTLITSE